MLRALALLALLAVWPASATPIFKDGFETMSQVTVPLLVIASTDPSGSDRTFTFDPVAIPAQAVSVSSVTIVAEILIEQTPGPPDPASYLTTVNFSLGSVPASLSGVDVQVDAQSVGVPWPYFSIVFNPTTDIEAWRDRRPTILVTPSGSLPFGYSRRVLSIEASVTFNMPPDYRMTGGSSATANRTDRINIAPRLGGQQGSSSVNVVVNLDANRRETSFRAASGSVFAVPRAAPSMRGLASSGSTMSQSLRRLRPMGASASSATTFTLPSTFRIGSALSAVGSSSVSADVRGLRRFVASFEAASTATGATIKIANVTGTASSGSILGAGLSVAQQFNVGFTAESGTNWQQGGLNILATLQLVGASAAVGSTANLYQGHADFNVDAGTGWSVTIDATQWSVWV